MGNPEKLPAVIEEPEDEADSHIGSWIEAAVLSVFAIFLFGMIFVGLYPFSLIGIGMCLVAWCWAQAKDGMWS